MNFTKVDDVLDIISRCEAALSSSGTSRGLSQSVMIHVVIAQHRSYRAAQKRGEMPRHRRDQQHARLRLHTGFFEMQQLAERRAVGHFFRNRDFTPAALHHFDAEMGPLRA